MYSLSKLELIKKFFEKDDELDISIIEYNKEYDNYFVLGILRNIEIKENRYFSANLVNDEMLNLKQ